MTSWSPEGEPGVDDAVAALANSTSSMITWVKRRRCGLGLCALLALCRTHLVFHRAWAFLTFSFAVSLVKGGAGGGMTSVLLLCFNLTGLLDTMRGVDLTTNVK